MDLHDLTLITAAFAAGFCLHYLLERWADHRAKHYVDGWRKADEYALRCQLQEAYRAGQEQANPHYIEAPAPWRG